ncbi:MAG: glutamine--tRNA ligase/YqeY domain fusion protein [Planctomycetota bacterium]
MTTAEPAPSLDFIRSRIVDDIAAGTFGGKVVTRFPPEPNGYLHFGHAKSICLNFGIAAEHEGAICHLRFDDTNPSREDVEFTESIKRDIAWLGFDWGGHEYFASDYFEQLYDFAVKLIRNGQAFVCQLSPDDIREHRGTLKEPGRNSPYRDRSVDENVDLFARMRAGEFKEGEAVLRAKIDMASPNLNMRDPVLYRIQHIAHHRTGDAWCIYPMYDYAHAVSDSIEGITHSLCTLEFEAHRPLYEWFLEQLNIHRSQQIEFARGNISHSITSKRKLRRLVEEGHVDGWDDPRMNTLAGMRRRGYTPAAIRSFWQRVGISKRDNVIELANLEHSLREDLNAKALRVMAVLKPLKVVIENYPEDLVEELEAINNPEDESAGTRIVPFSRTLYIERTDFMEDPPKKFFRLGPGREVRLRYGYFITCTDVIKDDAGNIIELRATYDPETRGGQAPDGRKVKGTIHWVSADHAVDAEVRLYDTLFSRADPEAVPDGEDFIASLNESSLEVLTGCKLERSLGDATVDTPYQFERIGYFCVDSKDHAADRIVFNRTVTLRDSWAKMAKAGKTN